MHIFESIASLVLELGIDLVGGLLVSDQNLRWMQSHLNEPLGVNHELTSKTEDEVGSITALLLLHFGGHGDHLGGWMMDVALLDNRRGI